MHAGCWCDAFVHFERARARPPMSNPMAAAAAADAIKSEDLAGLEAVWHRARDAPAPKVAAHFLYEQDSKL